MSPAMPADPMSLPHEGKNRMTFRVEVERETDGRWSAEIIELPGVLACGPSAAEAGARVQAPAPRVVAGLGLPITVAPAPASRVPREMPDALQHRIHQTRAVGT
jgi:hypothetical protein